MVDVTGEPKPEREHLAGSWSVTSHAAWQLEDSGEAFRCCSAASADRWARTHWTHRLRALLVLMALADAAVGNSSVALADGSMDGSISCWQLVLWQMWQLYCWHRLCVQRISMRLCTSAVCRWSMARCCCTARCGQQWAAPQPPAAGATAAAACLTAAMAVAEAEVAA